MFPFYSSIYQSASPRTVAEQREADIRAGELAAAIAELWRLSCVPIRLVRRLVPRRPALGGQDALAAHRCSHPLVLHDSGTLARPKPCRLCDSTAC